MINVLELPISVWTSDYYVFLDELIKNNIIKDYDKYSTDCDINIMITMVENIDILSYDDIIKTLHLESYLSINNMNLFDENNKMKLYNDQYDIINTFVDYRLNYYTKRKDSILNKLNIQKNNISNKIKFIKCIIKKEIIIENKKKDDIINQIESKKIDKYNDSYDYLLNIPILNLSKEKVDELKNQFDKIEDDISKILNLEEKNMWLSELNELKKDI